MKDGTLSRSATPLLTKLVAGILIPFELLVAAPAPIAAWLSPAPSGPLAASLAAPPDELLRQQQGQSAARPPAVPTFDRPSAVFQISASPSDQEISLVRLFEEPLTPQTATMDAAENADLGRALSEYSRAPKDVTPLTQFLSGRPDSRWKGSILANVGLIHLHQGRWSKAIAAWEGAWEACKGFETGRMKIVGDRALGELAEIHARLGNVERLEKLFAEIGNRDVLGAGAERVNGARSGLGLMNYEPGEAFRCGPLAVSRLFQLVRPGERVPNVIGEVKSTRAGTHLAALRDLAQDVGLNYQIGFRTGGAELPMPCVVHWKVGHFAALTKLMGNEFLSQDLTFGRDTLVSPPILDEEASGYFLVPAGPLPDGWRAVPAEEAKTIFGKGNAGPSGPPPPPRYQTTSNSCGAPGMPAYGLEFSSVALVLKDTPVGYAPPVGPGVYFTANYCSREYASTTNISNLGQWSFNWLSYLQIPSFAATVSYGPGGGQLTYDGFDAVTGTFAPQPLSQGRLVIVAANNYEIRFPDGSKDVYTLSEGGANPRIFRTSTVDPRGNAITFSYDTNFRMRTVTDALGQVSVIDYELSADPVSPSFYLITKVTDAFGRFATFQYNSKRQLIGITDAIGLTSNITYGLGGFINALTTPYGTSTFSAANEYTFLGVNYTPQSIDKRRWLEATDPAGGKERVEWVRDAIFYTGEALVTEPAEKVPTGAFNEWLRYRNTFYWDKKAMASAPGHYPAARIYHWNHLPSDNSQSTSIVESTKAPSENRVWYAYPGQTWNTSQGGSSNRPSKIRRVLDDGSTQQFLFDYNNAGNVIKSTDPVGRETTFTFASNEIDLLEVRQKRGSSSDLLATFTYNTKHQPLTSTGADGQTTTYTYNTAGQILTVTNPKSETTTFVYDSNGYLQTVTAPLSASKSFTYDSFGRVRTVTESTGYSVILDYDAFDRVTKVTYPDSTYEQAIYNRLDLEWSRDRMGRWSRTVYNAVRQVVLQQDPLLRRTIYEWCTCGSLVGLTDPAGNRTTWEYDVLARVSRKVYADATALEYQYDLASRLKKTIDAKGQHTNFQYFNDNSLKQVSYSNAVVATPTVDYTYDTAYPRVATMSDGTGTTAYAYNVINTTPALGAGRLASVDGPLANDTVTFTYDELGRQVSRAINGTANQSAVILDALGRVSSITNPLGAFALAYVGATSRLDHVDYPNGQKTQFDYFNSAGDERLKQIKHIGVDAVTVLSQHDYTYDPVGQIQTWTQNHSAAANPVRYEFRYDGANQLANAVLRNATTNALLKEHSYGYDKGGNRVQEQIDSNLTTSSFDATNRLTGQAGAGDMEFTGTVSEPSMVTVGGRTAAVDAAGNWRVRAPVVTGANSLPVVATDVNSNVTNKTINVTVSGGASRTLSYDLNGNLLNNGNGQTYDWDAANRLVKITQGGGVMEFVYDGAGNRVQEKLNGSIIKQWIWDGGAQPAEERDAGNTVTKRFFGGLGQQIAGTSYFFNEDHLGSVREMIDGSGAVRARYDYDACGRSTKVSGDLEADFGFTGFYRHQASGLSLTLFRAYDADLGRWLSRDPIGENGGINLYGYIGNDPINGIDPLGLQDLSGMAAQSQTYGHLTQLGAHPSQAAFYASQVGNHMPERAHRVLAELYQGLVVGSILGEIGGFATGRIVGAIASRWAARSAAQVTSCAAESGAARLSAADLKLSQTVENHLADLTKAGTPARPYGDSRLLMQEIMDAKPPVPDPGGVPGGLRWDVPGTMNGSQGTYQLVVDPKTGTVLHFLFGK